MPTTTMFSTLKFLAVYSSSMGCAYSHLKCQPLSGIVTLFQGCKSMLQISVDGRKKDMAAAADLSSSCVSKDHADKSNMWFQSSVAGR